MLKNRSGETIVTDDKPRKKLSFRDPEVVSPPRNGPHSAPSVLFKGSPSLPRHAMLRPHSISVTPGLSGSQGHVAVSPLPHKVTTAISRSASPIYPTRHTVQTPSVPSSPASSKKPLVKGHTRHGSWDGRPSPPRPKTPRPQEVQKNKWSPSPKPKYNRRSPSPKPKYNRRSPSPKPKYHRRSPSPKPKYNRRSPSRSPNTSACTPTSSSSTVSSSTEKLALNNSMSMEDLDLENQAMRIVRTVGQAFEVCHKLTSKEKSTPPPSDDVSQGCSEGSSDKPKQDEADSESGQEDLLTLTSNTYNNEDDPGTPPRRPSTLEPLTDPHGSDLIMKTGETFSSPLSDPLPMGDPLPQPGTPLSVHHEMQLMREQLEQQQQQTQAAVAQVHLLRDQLSAETAARLEAQARAHQLLVHNKELLEHIQQLVVQIREFEVRKPSSPRPTAQHSPTTPEFANQLSPSVESAGSWMNHLQRLNHQVTVHSLLSFPDTQTTPAPQFLFPPQSVQASPCGSSSPRAPASPMIFPLPLWNDKKADATPPQETKAGSKPKTTRDEGSTPSLGSDDLKRDSNPSSAESVTPSHASVYSDPWRLPQVPEDSVPLPPYGPVPLGADRGLGGSITRAASERYARQETLAHLQRMAWARHTTK